MNCKNCKYLKCYAINHQIYYCDNDNRIDDIGKLSIDKEPEGAPEWCPLLIRNRWISKDGVRC